MVLKVKEPIAEEYHRLREGLTLFTYLHLAADKPLTEELMAKKVTGIAYETVQLPSGCCRCSTRCLRSPAVWPPRSARTR
jgi:alanine dehydrogenase